MHVKDTTNNLIGLASFSKLFLHKVLNVYLTPKSHIFECFIHMGISVAKHGIATVVIKPTNN